jgi:AcrR family transcriptional regulator
MRARADTRARIRREALRLFVAAGGVDAVSVRDIAAAVGCRPSSLYSHWPSIDALTTEIFTEGYVEYGRRLAEAAAGPGPFPVRLEAMLRLICALHAEDRTLFEFLLLTQHRQLAAFGRTDANPVEVLHRAVAEAMAAGEVPPGDPALLAAAIVGVVVQAATFRHYGRIARGLDAMADEIVALCLRLISAPPAAPKECRR